MSVAKSIGTVLVCALVVCAVGGAFGGTIGAFIPGYYRSVFRRGHEPDFDPIAVGIGQGATQGLGGGILAGLILVGIIAWRERGLSRTTNGPESQPEATRRVQKPWGWILVCSGVGVLMLSGICVIGIFVGALIGEQRAYERRYQEEKQLIEQAMTSDPLNHQIRIERRSDGGAMLFGAVQTKADHDRLGELLMRSLGESRAQEIVAGVDVIEPAVAADGTP